MPPSDDRGVPAWRRYLRFLAPNNAGDVDDELTFHIQSAIDEYVASGMSPTEARDAARQRFGDVDGISHTLYTLSEQRERQMQRSEWLDTLKHDVVFGLRQLRKSPGFTTIAVLTLALGIGANSAIFSIVNTVMLRPLPFAEADRVVHLSQRNGSGEMYDVPYGNYDTWKKEATGYDEIGAFWGGGRSTLTGLGDPIAVTTFQSTASYWRVLRLNPLVGRYFTDEEERPGNGQVAILSSALWQRLFGGNPDVIGKSLNLGGKSYTVVGVAPSEYLYDGSAEAIWTPLVPTPQMLTEFADHELDVYGLIKRDVAPTAAARQLETVDMRLAQQHPHSFYDGGIIAKPLLEVLLGDFRAKLYLLMGAVGLVLLIACGNVANLLLARATTRRTEIAVRGALGASRRRITMQLLVESLLLGVAGGVLGIGVAAAGIKFLVSTPLRIPRLHDAKLDGTVLLFTFALALLCAIIFGLLPARRAARLDLQQTLRDGGRESRSATQQRTRQLLVVAELCLAQVLLIGAGLLIRSSLALSAVPIGFDTHNLLLVSVGLPGSRYQEKGSMEQAFTDIENRIAAVPGVTAVGRSQVVPILSSGWNWKVSREGSDGNDAGTVVSNMRWVSPTYFAALGLPVVRGRAFLPSDGPDAPKVAVISRGLANKLWPGADPIGHRISNGGDVWRDVVGVVDDMHANGIKDAPPPELYMPSSSSQNGGYTYVIRGGVPVETLLPAVRKAVASVDPLVALSGVTTMEEALGRQLALDRFTRWLFTLLGATGLVLAVVGVYGVIAFFVTQRHHEMGVRLALGASGSAVQWLVVKEGLLIAVTGVALGLPLAFASATLLKSFVFQVSTHDPVTFAAVAAVLAVVAVVASYIPARRATRIDPLEALRSS
jgi:predicted permease